MPRSIPFAIALGLLASTLTQAACSDDGEGQADFCGRLDVDCSLEVSECQDVLRGETIDHPGCDDIRQGLLECALDQALWSCPDSTTLDAGASYVSGGRQYNLQGYTIFCAATRGVRTESRRRAKAYRTVVRASPLNIVPLAKTWAIPRQVLRSGTSVTMLGYEVLRMIRRIHHGASKRRSTSKESDFHVPPKQEEPSKKSQARRAKQEEPSKKSQASSV